ncbi:MAG: hypothetical protein ACKPFD_10820 [Dolichospermum sp.]
MSQYSNQKNGEIATIYMGGHFSTYNINIIETQEFVKGFVENYGIAELRYENQIF